MNTKKYISISSVLAPGQNSKLKSHLTATLDSFNLTRKLIFEAKKGKSDWKKQERALIGSRFKTRIR